MEPPEAARILRIRETASEANVLDAYLAAVAPIHPNLHREGTVEREAAELVFAQLTAARDALLNTTVISQAPPKSSGSQSPLPVAPTIPSPPHISPGVPSRPKQARLPPKPRQQPRFSAEFSARPTIGAGRKRNPVVLIVLGAILFVVVLVLLIRALILVSAGNVDDSAGSGDIMLFTDVTLGTYECPDDGSCWAWEVKIEQFCAFAQASISFSDTSSGKPERFTTRPLYDIVPNMPQILVVEDRHGSLPEYAGIEKITCFREEDHP